MKVLLIWLGKMGQFHLQNLLNINSIEHIYAFDVFPETFKISSTKITYSTQLEDFDTKDFDFVDIVAPTKFHSLYLEKYIRMKKNIFVEKPIVGNKEEIEKLEAIIQQEDYNGKIGVGFIERFNVVSKFLKEELTKRGNPEQIEFFRYNPASTRIWDTGVTEDLMIHDIDLVQAFFENTPIHVVWKNINSDTATALLKADTTNIILSANRITQQKIREIKIYYQDVTIIWDLILWKIEFFHKPETYLSQKWQDLSISYLVDERVLIKNNQLKEELEEFCTIIHGWERKNVADYASSVNGFRVLENILQ